VPIQSRPNTDRTIDTQTPHTTTKASTRC
jgi:hypothetical protein